MGTPSSTGSSLRISSSVRDALGFSSAGRVPTLDEVRSKYGPPATLGAPNEDAVVAMDRAMEDRGVYTLLQHGFELGMYGACSNFLGYGALQNIAQNGLIRACIETVADDMTRAWIELQQEGEDDSEDGEAQERIERLDRAMKRLGLQKVMHEAAAKVGYYGGCLLYLDTGASGPDLKLPLSLESWSREATKGFLKGVRVVDPVNVFPGTYNSIDPLRADYYVPKSWWVLGQEVHASRLIRVFSNEPPLLFRPSYNFLGIPKAQILWDYVMHFQANRDSVNRLMDKFSQLVFKTAMTDLITGGANDMSALLARLQMMAQNRSNDGVIAIDKEAEDILKVETPMSGLTDVPRQSLEFVAAINRTPVVKLLGISPSGFNATGESDLRNYYDHILSQQEAVLRPALQRVLEVVQVSLFGEVDRKLGFSFCSLSEEDENAKAVTQATRINNLMALLDRDVISAEEARQLLIADPDSGLDGLDPELPEDAEGDDMLMQGPAIPGQPQMQAQEPSAPSPASPAPMGAGMRM